MTTIRTPKKTAKKATTVAKRQSTAKRPRKKTPSIKAPKVR